MLANTEILGVWNAEIIFSTDLCAGTWEWCINEKKKSVKLPFKTLGVKWKTRKVKTIVWRSQWIEKNWAKYENDAPISRNKSKKIRQIASRLFCQNSKLCLWSEIMHQWKKICQIAPRLFCHLKLFLWSEKQTNCMKKSKELKKKWNYSAKHNAKYPKLEELSHLKFFIKVSEFVETCLNLLKQVWTCWNRFQLVQIFPSCSKLVYIFLPMSIALSIGLKLPPPSPKKEKKMFER